MFGAQCYFDARVWESQGLVRASLETLGAWSWSVEKTSLHRHGPTCRRLGCHHSYRHHQGGSASSCGGGPDRGGDSGVWAPLTDEGQPLFGGGCLRPPDGPRPRGVAFGASAFNGPSWSWPCPTAPAVLRVTQCPGALQMARAPPPPSRVWHCPAHEAGLEGGGRCLPLRWGGGGSGAVLWDAVRGPTQGVGHGLRGHVCVWGGDGGGGQYPTSSSGPSSPRVWHLGWPLGPQ